MLGELLGGFIDKAEIAKDAIQDALENVCKELSEKDGKPYTHDDFIIAIKPVDGEFKFKCYILKATPEFSNSIPGAIVREITIKEIIEGTNKEE